MNNKLKFIRFVFSLALILFIAFIFSNSLKVGTQSSQQSSQTLSILSNIFSNIGVNIQISEFMHYIVRKMAHLAEYFILAILLFINSKLYYKNFSLSFGYTLCIAVLIPIIDEYIQMFMPGRVGQVSDVVLDIFGCLIGFVICFMADFLYKKFSKKQNYEIYD